MALVRAVSFEGVGRDRLAQMESEIRDSEPPPGLRPTEMIVLHDPATDKAIALVFFDNEEDYASGDEVLSAMPAAETPGRRTGVEKYEVALRVTP
jgi:hypothetical protein